MLLRSLTTLNLLFRVSFQMWLNLHAKVYHIDLLRSLGDILPVCRHWVDVGGGHCLPTHSLEFSQSWPVLLLPPVDVKFPSKGYFTCIPRRHRLLMTRIQNLIRRFRSSCLVAISHHFLNVHVHFLQCTSTYDQTPGSRTDHSRCILTSQFYNTNINSESEVPSTSFGGMDGSWKPSWKMYWQDSEFKSAFWGYF